MNDRKEIDRRRKISDSMIVYGEHRKLLHKNNKQYYDRYIKRDGEGICVCGKETKFIDSTKQFYREYCSYKCKAAYCCSSGKINKSEQKLLDLLKQVDANFIFIGDGSKRIARKKPDFVNESRKLIVELYGNYWHRNETEEQMKERCDLFMAEGYKTLIVLENELVHANMLKEKLISFAF